MGYLIGALVGAVIGFITNWLAIKMLFRPHYEKRLFGMRLPFTPGLIPKEKERIAKSVGEAVGTHLLTKEEIVKRFTSDAMTEQIDIWIRNEINSIGDSSSSIKEKGEEILGERYELLKEYLAKSIEKDALNYIRTDRVKAAVSTIIIEEMDRVISKNPAVILQSLIYGDIREKLIAFGDNKENPLVNNFVENILNKALYPIVTEDRDLKEVLLEEVMDLARIFIMNNSSSISKEIKKTINEENTKREIRHLIEGLLSAKVNPMISMFLRPESLMDKIIPFINIKLEEEATQRKIALVACELYDRLLETSPSKIAYEISKNLNEDIKDNFVKKITSYVANRENIEEVLNYFEKSIAEKESIKALIEEIFGDYEEKTDTFIYEFTNLVFESDRLEERISGSIKEIISRIEDTKISALIKLDSEEAKNSIITNMREFILSLVKTKGAPVVEAMNIPKIVEDNINSFEVDYAEKIIIDIANKELQAITWLGALLGAIMGLLSPILNSFMR